MNRDPIFGITGEDAETAVGPNIYAYVRNGPTGHSDLPGLAPNATIGPGQNAGGPGLPNGYTVYSTGTGNTWTYNAATNSWSNQNGGTESGNLVTGGQQNGSDTATNGSYNTGTGSGVTGEQQSTSCKIVNPRPNYKNTSGGSTGPITPR